jgi:dienelactone hydrolase
MSASRRQVAVRIGMQLAVMSILTLITVAAFTHIATMLIFRRLVIGNSKRPADEAREQQGRRVAERHPSGCADTTGAWSEEFFVPVRSDLLEAASIEDVERDEGFMQKIALGVRKIWGRVNDIPNSLRAGVTREIYVRHYHHRRSVSANDEQMLLLCNPSGESVDTIAGRTVALSEAIGFDSLVMFDYRPTGRSCQGLVAPDTQTMLEDAESVMQWLITVNGVNPENISVAGISLGGIQALRLAARHKSVPRLILLNTFASFACILRTTATLLPGAVRFGGTSAFLPNITHELRQLSTPKIVVVSVEIDERIPTKCTEEMLNTLREAEVGSILHVKLKGTHGNPNVDHNSLELIREFLTLREPLLAFDT